MDLEAIHEAIATATSTISGLRGYPSLPGNINPPVIAPIEFQIDYNKAFGNALSDLAITLGLYVSKGDTDTGRKALLGYLAPTGGTSIKAALEGDRTLGGTCKTLIVRRVHGLYVLAEVGGIAYLSASIDLEVWA